MTVVLFVRVFGENNFYSRKQHFYFFLRKVFLSKIDEIATGAT